jgi:hypothetical protein
MRRVLLLLYTTVLLPSAARAQSTDADIQRALLAAPAAMRAAATVLELRPDGTTAVLRPGTNGLICWDNGGRPGFIDPVDVECTAEANRVRLEQNHVFQSAGGTEAEIQARFDKAEADGNRVTSVFGTIYYRVIGSSLDDYRTHTAVAVPYATGESIGLPTARGPALLWLMEAGTSSAHLMVSGM